MIKAAIGRYAHTEHLFEHPTLDLQPYPTISRAFAPMVREQRFDMSEMAIATFLQARAYGSDLVLLPVTMAARFQNAALLRRSDDPFGPDDLAGKRIGVRAYSQTTGLWLRGILSDSHGLDAEAVRWITFEDAHVAACQDPPWATRASPGSDMLAMLRSGAIDAAIFGNDTPTAPDLATVFPDPEAAGQAFWQQHHFTPVNHLVTITPRLAAQPGAARALMDQLKPGNPHPWGRQALTPALALATRYAHQQGLIPHPLTPEQIWSGLPRECEE